MKNIGKKQKLEFGTKTLLIRKNVLFLKIMERENGDTKYTFWDKRGYKPPEGKDCDVKKLKNKEK